MAVLFNLIKNGSGSVGSSVWLDLGVITTGFTFWIGRATYTAIDKNTSFELRTNTTGQSAGTTGATTLLDTAAVKAGASIVRDLYKNGRLHIKTVIGTGVEHWWLRVYAKSNPAGDYQYSISYTTE